MVDDWEKITVDDLKTKQGLREEFEEKFAPHIGSGRSVIVYISKDEVVFQNTLILSEDQYVEDLDYDDELIEDFLDDQYLAGKDSSFQVIDENSKFDSLPKKLRFQVDFTADGEKWENAKDIIKQVEDFNS